MNNGVLLRAMTVEFVRDMWPGLSGSAEEETTYRGDDGRMQSKQRAGRGGNTVQGSAPFRAARPVPSRPVPSHPVPFSLSAR